MPGFEKGQRLKKIGLKAQDTSELFFDNVEVPLANLLGAENSGFISLMQELPWERLQIAIGAVASAQVAIERTLEYVKERKAFGQTVAAFQNTRFTLAELQTAGAGGAGVRRPLHRAADEAANSTPPPRRWPSTGRPTCSAR